MCGHADIFNNAHYCPKERVAVVTSKLSLWARTAFAALTLPSNETPEPGKFYPLLVYLISPAPNGRHRWGMSFCQRG
jgi:hypothetical protein